MSRCGRKVTAQRGGEMSEEAELSSNEEGEALSNGVRLVAGAAILAALTGALVLYYRTQVCDQQLTQTGSVVNVCRTLQVTDPPVTLISLVILVALTAFFSEISGFGI